jgi:hypothetical protein
METEPAKYAAALGAAVPAESVVALGTEEPDDPQRVVAIGMECSQCPKK